jgi:ribose transport system ATP-binding protein
LVILDEPTSVLERGETEILEREIRDLKRIGSVIFVSHRLDEVLRICDRVVVMRSGGIVAERSTADVDEDELFRLMVGRNERAEIHQKEGAAAAKPVLQVEGLGRTHIYKDVNISLTPGRTVAIVGTNGSGRESVCRAIFGAEAYDEGTLRVGGQEVRSWSMRQAVRSGIAYVPSERRVEGMIGGMDAAENLTLVHPGASRRGPFLLRRARTKIATEWFEQLDVRPRDPALDLGRFSGGNQQKVVMAKWLQADDLKVLVLDHPLRGLDPGAAETVNEQIRATCERGTAVLLLADTLEEALHMGDEILVMRDGEVTARFDLAVEAPTVIDLLEKMV